MYKEREPGSPVTRGDILDDCPIVALEEADPDGDPARGRVRVIVLTQACDLAQSKATRAVVALVHTASHLVETGILKAETVRSQVRLGRTFGWYFLPAAPLPVHLPESIVDLRDLHTASTAILQRLLGEGKGVCQLSTPYREHLAQHFGLTYMRIGLPEPYETQP
jgi:hypothetical protein